MVYNLIYLIGLASKLINKRLRKKFLILNRVFNPYLHDKYEYSYLKHIGCGFYGNSNSKYL